MFAGQITGCEGYVESAAIGMLSGYFASCLIKNIDPLLPPITTALGSMHKHLQDDTDIDSYQPMNINFGLFPTAEVQITPNGKKRKLKGMDRKEYYCNRALTDLQAWLEQVNA
jgi:methylenetetrahydrofolate--tRNA-(uracil-5-)-methyltransferase